MDLEDKENNLFPIRCPFERISKSDDKLYKCNSLCVKTGPSCYGESRCRKCHLNFQFAVDENGIVTTGVRVKPV
jgi:hypothetical protein